MAYTQTDLNLAINYMVIEKTLKCMGLLSKVKSWIGDNADGDVLEVIFRKAENGTLNQMFNELLEAGEDNIINLYEALHSLFGLDHEVLFGSRQINLGIKANPNIPYADELTHMSLEKLSEAQDEPVEDDECDVVISQYPELVWLSQGDSIKTMDQSIGNGIGQAQLLKGNSWEEQLKQINYNPLGINNFGAFIALLNNKTITYHSTEDFNDFVNQFFILYFNSLDEDLRGEDIDEEELKLRWQNNIYCLEALIYSITRKSQEGLYEHNRRNGKIDKVSKQYNIFVEEINRSTTLINGLILGCKQILKTHKPEKGEKLKVTVPIRTPNGNIKQSPFQVVEAHKDGKKASIKLEESVDYGIFDKLVSENNLIPPPFLITSDSELLALMRYMMHMTGFEFNAQLTDVKWFGTILEEIEYWKVKGSNLAEMCEVLKEFTQDDEIQAVLDQKLQELANCNIYIQELEESQRLFQSNPGGWLAKELASLDQSSPNKDDIEKFIQKKFKSATDALDTQKEKEAAKAESPETRGRPSKIASPTILFKEPHIPVKEIDKI